MLMSLPQDGLCTLALQVKLSLGVIIANSQALHAMGFLHHKNLVVKNQESNTEEPSDTQKIPWSGFRSPQRPSET